MIPCVPCWATGSALSSRRADRLDLEDAIGVGQPAVVAGLVADVDEQHQAGGEAESEAEDVDEGVGLAPGQRPEADGQIITPHGLFP